MDTSRGDSVRRKLPYDTAEAAGAFAVPGPAASSWTPSPRRRPPLVDLAQSPIRPPAILQEMQQMARKLRDAVDSVNTKKSCYLNMAEKGVVESVAVWLDAGANASLSDFEAAVTHVLQEREHVRDYCASVEQDMVALEAQLAQFESRIQVHSDAFAGIDRDARAILSALRTVRPPDYAE